MDAVCTHLQAVAEGRIKRLLIAIPPGHAKSLLVSVLFPAWVWTRKPTHSFIAASYALSLSMRDAVRSRELLTSDWYTATFRPQWTLKEDQNLKSAYANTLGGARLSLSVGGAATGFRTDTLIIDDPLKAEDAYSELKREEARRWKAETMSTRFNDLSTATEIVIMQRLHEDDLAGHLIASGEWEVLSLPTEFDPAKRTATSVWTDPRKEDGELLFPQKFPRVVVDGLKRTLGSYAYSAQHLQSPSPAQGGMLRRVWFSKRWSTELGASPMGLSVVPLPVKLTEWTIAVDCSFKGSEGSDRVAIGVFAKGGQDVYALDMAWRNMGFQETCQAILDMKAKWPNVRTVLIEDKANGSAVIEVLKQRIAGIIPVQPEGGKEVRIAAITPYLEAGNLVLPLSAQWVADFVEEAVSFPKGKHDDAIDMTAYALVRLCGSQQNRARMLATL